MAKTLPTREHTLPSGKVATIRPGIGRDMLAAQRVAPSNDEIPYAIIAMLCLIDGQVIVFEDVLDLDLADVIDLQKEVLGTGKSASFSPPPSTSSSSASSPAGRSKKSKKSSLLN